jgi:hypothetical protein
MSKDTEILVLWKQLKDMIDAIEVDVAKNSNGIAAAGTRARRGLRALKAKATEITKLSIALGKEGKKA